MPLIDTDAATIAPILETLIAQHGIAKVDKALAALLPGRNWNDWQKVQNMARQIANRRKKKQ